MTDGAAGDPTDAVTRQDSAAAELAQSASVSVPRWAVIGIFLLLLVAGIAYARDFLIPLVLAFLLTLVFSPVRRFLERRGRLPSTASAVLIVAALVTILVTVVAVLAEPVQQLIDDAPKIGRRLENRLRGIAGPAKAVVKVGEQVDQITSGEKIAPTPSTKKVQEVVVRKPGFLANLAEVAPGFLAQGVFTLVLLFFLLASGDMIYEKIVRVMPTLTDKKLALRIAYDIERKLSHYLFTITLINAALGLSIGLAMWWLDMPTPLLFGVMGFLFNFVPYLGAIAGTVVALVVGLITFNEIGSGVVPALVYFALTSIEGQLVTPHVVGRRLEMNTVVVFISVAFWAWLWSVMGMLVAVPLLVTIRAFCEHIPQLVPLGNFISAPGQEAAEAGQNGDAAT